MKENFVQRALGTAAVALAIGGAPVPAAAIVIGFEAEVHTGNADFAIRNTSDAGVFISQVILRLGDNMQFDTASGSPAFDPVATSLLENTGTAIGHFTNSILNPSLFPTNYLAPSSWTTQSGTVVGFVGTLGASVVDGGKSATLAFSDFARGEAWGFNVDYDTLTGDADPVGDDMNNASIQVTFTDSAGNFLGTLSFNYGTFSANSNKKSFPSDTGNLQGPWTTISLLEPGTVALLGLGLIGLAGGTRLRQRRTDRAASGRASLAA